MISSIPSAGLHMYGVALGEEMISFPGHHSLDEQITHPTVLPSPQTSLLHNFSLLKDKVAQLNSFLNLFLSSGTQDRQLEAATVSVSTMAILLQDILSTASSMMFSCQQMTLNAQNGQLLNHHRHGQKKNYGNISHHSSTGYPPKSDTNDNSDCIDYGTNNSGNVHNEKKFETIDEDDDDHMINLEAAFDKELENGAGDSSCYDIVEMGADDLLAEYTHYCHICGKGFKRDANLRMHMRAHGDEYKSNASLSKPFSAMNGSSPSVSSYGNNTAPPPPRKYSCPHEGCRWNKRHAKFTPLKSMICVRNHYKRSHCPKMYVCKRCNKKKFSVLSDLRTHEKHCGDLKWRCSCGTTFSRKDKLLGHVALFVGHMPAGNCAEKMDHRENMIEGFSTGRT